LPDEIENDIEESGESNSTLVFGAASFLNDMGSDLIAPIWPTFLRNHLLLSFFQVGLIDGLAITITALSKIGAGYASDKSGKRKPFITLGYFMSMVGRLGFIIAASFYHILFWKSMDRLGKMRSAPRDAIVAAMTTEEKRGRAFGVLRALDSAGAVVGAIISYLLFIFIGYFGLFLLAAIPTAGSVIIIATCVKEKRGKDVFKGINFRGLDRNLKLFFLSSALFALATFSYSFLMLFSSGFGYADGQLPLLYILFAIVYATAAYPFGQASDRIGRKPILIVAFALLILTAAWAYLVHDWITVIPLFILFGLSTAALDPVQTALVADLVEEESRASILGAFQMVIGLCALPAGMIIGYLWETIGALMVFQYSMVFAGAATMILLMIRVKDFNVAV
jgi:MFS family permease